MESRFLEGFMRFFLGGWEEGEGDILELLPPEGLPTPPTETEGPRVFFFPTMGTL